ncbi:hypothetical protein [Natrinema sp. CBA1119]|uniref:hypothetical protein n=1 Tax=Natrinema sp. CBA1119 TaxID=1608465 RepID=UPI001145C729|nr:hypothetical protein [Natrinema sp. CBA1119]
MSRMISPQTIELAGLVVSSILSLFLVILYRRQTIIQKNQTRLMRQERLPELTVAVDLRGNIPILVIQNTGESPAKHVFVTWYVHDGEKRRIKEKAWSAPIVSSGERIEVVLATKDEIEDVYVLSKEEGQLMSKDDIIGVFSPPDRDDFIPDEDVELFCTGTYNDKYGESYNIRNRIELITILSGFGNQENVSRSNTLHHLVKEVSGIGERISSLERELRKRE